MAVERWRVVYDLAADPTLHEMAARTRAGDGLAPEPAVIGTDQWWQLVGSPRLPLRTFEGVIDEVTWTGHNDFPEFTVITHDGVRRSWQRYGDHTVYVEGLRVRVQCVEHPWATPNEFADFLGDTAEVCIRVELEESDRRSPLQGSA